jgi:type I restriction-modification system DNA methylase subunit
MISRRLVEGVSDEASLLALLNTSQESGGLGWPVSSEFAFEDVPEIAFGAKKVGKVRISRLVGTGQAGEWLVLLAEFENAYARRDLREILRSLKAHIRATGKFADFSGHADTLFIAVKPGETSGYQDVRFVLFQQQEGRQAKIRSFGWTKDDIGRTLLEHNLPGLTWSNLQQWIKAWDVEALTKQFFKDYRDVFNQVEESVQPQIGSEDLARRFTQTFFNRLIFVCFLQKKGWLEPPITKNRSEYLFDLYKNFSPITEGPNPEDSFYDRLQMLFFSGLNSMNGEGGRGSEIEKRIGRVPFLNGGLFEQDKTLDRSGIKIMNGIFDQLLGENGLLRRYNFTIDESTPDDVNVALDPELLGMIFEELVNDRHETGSYYTPRPIVSFMCRESLKGYLGGYEKLVDDHDASEISVPEAKELLRKLETVTVCDPACGSGAYLVGMLYEIEALIKVLDTRAEQGTARDDHARRLLIIQNCLYGVDIQKFAVNIAWLRLWLALIIEETRNPLDDPKADVSLPNLDVKIGVGDSLMAPLHTASIAQTFALELASLRRAYMHAHSKDDKDDLRDKMERAREEITHATGRTTPKEYFDWQVEFSEVWAPQEAFSTLGGRLNLGPISGQCELTETPVPGEGFDIVVANPPYVNSTELLQTMGRPYKQALIRAYPQVGSGSADLLVYFMVRAIQLLRPGGQFAFITSNLWLKAPYGKKIRGHMVQSTRIKYLIDFGHLPVFQGTMAFPLITLATKRSHQEAMEAKTRMTRVTSLDAPYPDMHAIIRQSGAELPSGSLQLNGEWNLEVGESTQQVAQIRSRGIPLGDFIKGKVYYGIKTGLNEVKIGSDGKMYGKRVPAGVRVVRKEGVFVINGAKRAELIAEDPKSAEIIKPLAIGRDVRRWVASPRDRWLVFTRRGIDIEAYPAVKRHLERYRVRLEPKPRGWQSSTGEWQGRKAGSYKWYEVQDEIAYWQEFEGAKLVWGNLNNQASYGYLGPGIYVNAPAVILAPEDLFVLGILNSRAGWKKLTEIAYARNGGYFETKPVFVKQVEIPFTSQEDKLRIEALVREILDLKSHNPSSYVGELEAEIDARVEFLYFHRGELGTRPNDAGEEVPYPDTYDEWVALREAEAGTAVGEVRQLLAIGHETNELECKSTFAWDVKKGEKGDYLKDEVHTAICALLNAKGGNLLVGVEELPGDRLQVRGLVEDLARYGGKDGLISAIEQPLGKTLNPNPIGLVDIKAVDIDGKTIIRIQVTPDNTERYRFKEKIYVRRNSKSKPELTPDDAATWWPKRQRGDV